jgi:hypothetical protein
MYIIETFTNNKNRVEFWVVEKFDKPNKYGDLEMLRAKVYSLKDAKEFINNKKQ